MRKDFAGAARGTLLSAGITAVETTITIADATGWPTGTNPFVAQLRNVQTGGTEKVLCSARAGTTLTVQTRGYDGTTAQAFSTGDIVEHVIDAVTIDQANAYANTGHLPLAGGIMTGSVRTLGLDTRLTPNIDVKVVTDGANTYPAGYSQHYVNTQGGWPSVGIVETFRDTGVSGGSMQQLTTSNNSNGPQVFVRRSTSVTAWTPWSALVEEEINLPARCFIPVGPGSPTIASTYSTTYLPAWYFDPSTDEAIATMIQTPPTWNYVSVDLYWFCQANTGTVVWSVSMLSPAGAPGEAITTSGVGGSLGIASPGTNILAKTTITPSVQVTGGKLLNITVSRIATSGSDTFASDAYLLHVVARRSS